MDELVLYVQGADAWVHRAEDCANGEPLAASALARGRLIVPGPFGDATPDGRVTADVRFVGEAVRGA